MDLPHHELFKRRTVPAHLHEDLFSPGVAQRPAPAIQDLLVNREAVLFCKSVRVVKKFRPGNHSGEGPGRSGGPDADEAEP